MSRINGYVLKGMSMNKLFLKKPSIFDIEKLDEYNNEFSKIDSNFVPSITKDNFKEKLKELELWEQGLSSYMKNIKCIFYFIMRDNKIIGTSSIRINPEDNQEYSKYAGHIGYEILPNFRNKGYGSLACHTLLKECQKLGLKEVQIICDEKNHGSQKVIENNMGILRHVCIYNGEITNRIGKMLCRVYNINIKKSLANFDESDYKKIRVKPSIAQICNIDRSNLNDFLINNWQNKIGSYLNKLAFQIGNIQTKEDLQHFYLYFLETFTFNPDKAINKYERTSEDIAKSKVYVDSHDISMVFASILRANNIPTLYVQAVDIVKKINDSYSFLEIYLSGKWQLFDSMKGILYNEYDYNNLSLPHNYYAFSKSLNRFSMGIISNKNNTDIITSRFKDFDMTMYQDPKYEEINLNFPLNCNVLKK